MSHSRVTRVPTLGDQPYVTPLLGQGSSERVRLFPSVFGSDCGVDRLSEATSWLDPTKYSRGSLSYFCHSSDQVTESQGG